MEWKEISEGAYQVSDVYGKTTMQDLVDEFNPRYNTWIFGKNDGGGISEYGELEITSGPLNSNSWYNNDLGWNYKFLKLSTEISLKIKKIIRKDIKLHRIQTNIQYHSMDAGWHYDYDDPKHNAWSFVTFINSYWEQLWDGQFVLSNKNGEMVHVSPTPDTGILFDAKCYHRGGAPNRFCSGPRMSLAYVFEEIDTL